MNGKILYGDRYSALFVIPDEVEVQPILEGHFEDEAGAFAELWGLSMHPTEPLFCSSSDDCTLRLWSLELGSMILLANVVFPSRSCAFSHDGALIAVGHQNGCFSVWDSMTLTPVVPFTRKRQHPVLDISFSPDGRFMALAMGSANCVDVYYVKKDFEYVGCCDTIAAQVKRMDWSLDSRLLQCCTSAYEVLRFNIPSCEINQLVEVFEETWYSHASYIGWGVQGIWEGCSEGTDVHACARSADGRWLCVGYDTSRIRLYNYPCIPKVPENSAKPIFPRFKEYVGHSSHVTQVFWSHDGRYVISSGGMDLTILRWRVVDHRSRDTSAAEKSAHKNIDTTVDDTVMGKIRDLGDESKKHTFVDEQQYVEQPPSSASPLRSTTKSSYRRPLSGNKDVKSRLLETTASMAIRAQVAQQHREHVERHQKGQRRFNAFV
jgi:WD40 repeat protein